MEQTWDQHQILIKQTLALGANSHRTNLRPELNSPRANLASAPNFYRANFGPRANSYKENLGARANSFRANLAPTPNDQKASLGLKALEIHIMTFILFFRKKWPKTLP